jgi:hypothetical protein
MPLLEGELLVSIGLLRRLDDETPAADRPEDDARQNDSVAPGEERQIKE